MKNIIRNLSTKIEVILFKPIMKMLFNENSQKYKHMLKQLKTT